MIALLATLAQWVNPLVETVEGELPIVISAPHGGKEPIPGSSLRRGDGKRQFVTVRDTGTDALARATADIIKQKTGKSVWLCVAKFSRKYCDVNRPEQEGTEDAAAVLVYRAYHSFLRRAVSSARKASPEAIFVDVHAQGQDRAKVFRGTQNGKTWSDRGTLDEFTQRLVDRGWDLFPAPRTTDRENPRLNGGYNVITYGQSKAEGVGAIQLEFGGSYKTATALDRTAETLADALIAQVKISSLRAELLPAAPWATRSRS